MKIRKASCAGTWYPGDPIELTKTIAGYFSEIEKVTVENRPLALIAPHAGYTYSGKTAAAAYKLLDGFVYDTVVVIAPSHKVFFKGATVFDGDGYETPLGIIEIDKTLSEKIGTILPNIYLSQMGHGEGAARGEHSLELQLPFLQVVLGNFKLVAIVIGEQEETNINALAEVLAATLKNKNALIVASTDLSHFHSAEKANRLDMNIKKAVDKFDPDLLWEFIEDGKAEACGAAPMAAAMKAAKRLGGVRTETLSYSNSGETTGDFKEVVGYLAAAVIAGKETVVVPDPQMGAPAKKNEIEFSISIEDKQALLKIAKDAIEAKLGGREYTAPEIPSLSEQRGVFVTLNIQGELRGCIGMMRSNQPLYDTVAEMAVAAAFDDPRFERIAGKEFKHLQYEISVLSPLKRVNNINDIKVGRDGLMVKLDLHSGLLLPQVAKDYSWDKTTFLEQTCLKAGLPRNSYHKKDAEIYSFQAVVF